MKMIKSFLRITMIVLISLFLAISCKKDEAVDYTIPTNLAGTAWKCIPVTSGHNDIEYATLKFTSTTKFQNWIKVIGLNETIDSEGSYTIDKNTITFDMGTDGIVQGTINGTAISILSETSEGFVTFKKQ
jgi:hypothetical protein